MKKKGKCILFILVVILNLLSLIPAVCDAYAEYVFPWLIWVMGNLTSLVPFSVGEWMIVLGILLTVAMIMAAVFAIIKKEFRSFAKKCGSIYLDILIFVLLVLTLNWTLINRCTPIMESSREYQISELEELRDALVVTTNKMALEMERAEDQTIILDGDVQLMAESALRNLEAIYPRLGGYYPKMKPMMFSDLMSQSRMEGYYFPFSMEANYNTKMYLMNLPECYCHELSHVKGYMREDEANFLSYLACINSDNAVFRYSGFLSVLYYVDNAFYENVGADYYKTKVQISKQVRTDNQFLTPEAMEEVEKKAIISTETVKKYSDSFNEATIKFGGVPDGMASYDRVTELLLMYYFQ